MATAQDIILLILGAAIGFILGWHYFRNLKWSAKRHTLDLEWKGRLEKLSSKYHLGIEKLTGKFKLAQEKRSKEHEVALEKLTKEWQVRYIEDIEELKRLFKENEKVIRQKSVSASRRSLVGKFVEKFVPFLAGIKYAPADRTSWANPSTTSSLKERMRMT